MISDRCERLILSPQIFQTLNVPNQIEDQLTAVMVALGVGRKGFKGTKAQSPSHCTPTSYNILHLIWTFEVLFFSPLKKNIIFLLTHSV